MSNAPTLTSRQATGLKRAAVEIKARELGIENPHYYNLLELREAVQARIDREDAGDSLADRTAQAYYGIERAGR